MPNKSAGHIHDIEGNYLVLLEPSTDFKVVAATVDGTYWDISTDFSSSVPKDSYAVLVTMYVTQNVVCWIGCRGRGNAAYAYNYGYPANSVESNQFIIKLNPSYPGILEAKKMAAGTTAQIKIDGYWRKIIL